MYIYIYIYIYIYVIHMHFFQRNCHTGNILRCFVGRLTG